MPRPDYIASLHAAKYDLRFCDAANKAEMWRRYREILAAASRQSGIRETLLEAAVARDFSDWVRQERLPKPPRKSERA